MKTDLYVVIAPGVSVETVVIDPNIVKLGWAFAQASDQDLIDQMAAVDKYQKILEKWKEAAKGVLKTRLPVPDVIGTETVTRGKFFEAHYSKSERADIDRDMVKAYFGERYPEYCKTTEVLTLKIIPIVMTPTT